MHVTPDPRLLTDVNVFLGAMKTSHCKDQGLDMLANADYWKNLSKTASHSVPALVARSFGLLINVRDQLVKLHESPELLAAHKKIIGLQEELLQCQKDQLQSLQATVVTSVESTVKAEFQSYSDAVQQTQKSMPQPPMAQETVKTIVKSVMQEEDRSRSFIVFNLPEEKEEQINSKVGELLQELDEKPTIEASRLGTPSKDSAKTRPVKVILSSSAAVNQILSKARRLRESGKHKTVFICQDRSPEDRAQHRLLVAELKKRRKEDPDRKYYIRGGIICDGGLRGNDSAT